jgi:Clp amino terminal domain, pathogenicity island component
LRFVPGASPQKRHPAAGIGTEHLLLGVLRADDGAGPGLSRLGLTEARAEQALAEEFARIQTRRHVSR